jgi:hypothetical protein
MICLPSVFGCKLTDFSALKLETVRMGKKCPPAIAPHRHASGRIAPTGMSNDCVSSGQKPNKQAMNISL